MLATIKQRQTVITWKFVFGRIVQIQKLFRVQDVRNKSKSKQGAAAIEDKLCSERLNFFITSTCEKIQYMIP